MNLTSFFPGNTLFPQSPQSGDRAQPAPRVVARRPRFLYILGFFVLWTTIICLRLVWLQVVLRPVYIDKANRQQQRTFEVLPRRGILYDRNLHEMAVSVLADSVFVVPYEITDSKDPQQIAKAKLATASALAKVVHTDPDDSFTSAERIDARLLASRDYAWVARGLDPSVIAQVKALNLKGVHIQKEFKRFYPDNRIAAQVLGYVGTDATGLGGLEQNFEDELHGTPGRTNAAFDAKRHMLGSQQSEPVPGENLVLTLDENIQFMAEQALDHAMERTRSINGTVVVQDPHTGQILALAIRPTFNPNDFRHATGDLRRNHAVSDVYEPGSTFKLVTYSAALEEKVTDPDKLIDCHGGQMNVAGRIVHDDHYNGVLSTSQALWESSDVAAIQLAQRMGPNTFYKYIRSYGFGERSGIEVPGETRGLLKPVRRWNPTTIGSIPMGQEIAVTPVQLITMASTIANGGMYLPPHILLASTDEVKGSPKLKPSAFHPGDDLPDPLPDGAHRVISTLTAAQMRKMMEGVVLFGTGKNAQLNGYSSAGKTGTAQKIDIATHTYSKSKYIASFVGFAPVNNPAITVAVIMDSPSDGGHHGAQASAPVFHELAQEVLEYLGVPHDIEVKSAPDMAKALASQGPQEHAPEANESVDSLFAEVNDLPADDPLRLPKPVEAQPVSDQVSSNRVMNPDVNPAYTYQPVPAAQPVLAAPAPPEGVTPAPSPHPVNSPADGAVVVDSTRRVAVPSFLGEPVRHVIEQAGISGLAVEVVGNGMAREQAPPPGTMVPAGTEVVVRFTRQ
ncbi:Cell division protein FtsI [Peptidoglycan synthetase] [Acidisarcina polymorpha]|uniref:Cell division protein FtsI [Peptidoglycan synthetase] n=1 Tax=Acidisarcina polymorpha TaxID=2211140 RepID=A0A2Z5FVH5_9BACT|nr:penicillin-binding protein [Acidisarcina polymorpha]AXC10851.1 Cell division protein FtsI [Peptidoglycan synthetase] [Acidisarcina polymorpha]